MVLFGEKSHSTVETYLTEEEFGETRNEFTKGEPYPRSDENIGHNTVAGNLVAYLHHALRGKSGQVFNSLLKVRIDLPTDTRFYYPDCSVACSSFDKNAHSIVNPTLVAEVISSNTRRVDLHEKLEAYLTIPSLKVVLLIEPDFPQITLHRRSANGGFEREVYKSLRDEIPLPEIEATLSVAKIYERIEFE